MLIQTDRFGAIEVKEEEVFTFPRPMLGFPGLQEYVLLPLPDNQAFHWLQATADPAVAFLLVDPFLFFSGYEVNLPGELEKELGLERLEDVLVYAVVTLPPGEVAGATANLVAPVILSPRSRKGRQVVLEETSFTTRHRLFTRRPERNEQAAGGGL